MSLKEGRGYHSNQGMIWNELAMKSERMAVNSKTGAMADLFDGHKNRLEEYLKAFRLVDCQIGAVYAAYHAKGARFPEKDKDKTVSRQAAKIAKKNQICEPVV